jgi:hypothetical protein
VNAGPPDRPGDTQQRRPYWAGLWTHAAAYATLAVGLAWLAVDDRRLRHEAGRHSEERGALAGRNQALSREIDALRQRMQAAPNAGQPSRPGSSWPAAAPSELWTGVMLRLGPGRVRGQDASAALIVATARARLELLLDLPDAGLHTYRAEIQTADGAVAARRGRLRARPMDGQWVVAFDLDRGLAAGDYVVVLTYADSAGRTAAAGEYFFRVVSR